ncbi:hypothetical protein PPYR_09280 [Photinus pyralis]|uniref:EGF domain-specific O-linked N-acetylglucosamine transferase n=3 Tax=Photinus pyralis TaxID=7054 RepID=A0A1Y1KZI8_PHOPY|nr:EGF domain-specific O-linked N-acetylglucosamine transferase isoform X1 [Photinus pyralis]KAB0798287.1 hypothetical protein PPYR_09280 [Photinus pyralis]
MLSHLLLLIFSVTGSSVNFNRINLPKEHLPYYLYNFPEILTQCQSDPECAYSDSAKDVCWGYEYNCTWDKQYSIPHCPGDHRGWVKTKYDQQNTFYTQADFGYVKQQIREMKVLCEPLFRYDSSLECSEHMRFCRGRNIMMNFTSLLNRDEPLRYKMDVLGDGDVGGHCSLHKDKLLAEADHISPLQSWGPELRHFKQLDAPIQDSACDVTIEKPTFIMKIDATVNMYHHFCDFLNLYASIHVNLTHWEAFSTDIHVLIWESYTYYSSFELAWQAFTDHPLWDLKTFRGKTVCFKNVVFPLLPRMIFGLYYNTPVIYGCENSGLFHAFSRHMLHRLGIEFHPRQNKKIRITLLSRDTKYRNILNEDALLEALQENEEYEVRRVVYNKHVDFKTQIGITHNTDVFIGMHGAGLTHLLFLPDWAVVFELYNCEDENCYFDLARLRGVKYITWEDSTKLIQEDEGTHPSGGAHAKFTNYSFDLTEFLRLVTEAVDHVKEHKKFQDLMKTINVHNEL